MVGDALYVLYFGCVLRCQIPVDVPECPELPVVEVRQLRQRDLAQGDETRTL